ncbi:uncharacterized protein PV09_07122 [Verruconis gallopava]|uniref:Uncharacterized protein n=1 Tax=Verruconis gallopava TaxID=253628 RepID=A0A0D2A4F9_9PEZI|nr:uncharacterized protein PV09_07122 [Verruconis gallopava]KIW01350.1 hypothetical protein PV09_07122 [Verruconis gallopava]
MAFRQTQRLYARTEARVKGFRGPGIKILRDAIVGTSEIELPGVLKQDLSAKRSQPSAGRIASSKTTFGSGTSSIPKSELLALQRSRYGWGSLKPSKRKHALDWSPPPHGSRDSVRWKHVVYSYNKNKTQAMPLLTSKIRRVAQAYLNMERKPEGYDEAMKGKNPNTPKFGIDARQKAFVSGHTFLDQPVFQDLLGKFTEIRKSFMIPYRELLKMEPPVIFKHRANSCHVSLHVHDERLQPPQLATWQRSENK